MKLQRGVIGPSAAATLRCRQCGVTSVESALVMLFILTIIFVIIDGARLINAHSSVAYAAREGVRFGAVRGTEAGADSFRPLGDAPATEQQIANFVQSRVPNLSLQVAVTWPTASGGGELKDAGSFLDVTVQSNFVPVVPMLSPTTVSSTSRMVIFY